MIQWNLIKKTEITKVVARILMLLFHLFCTKQYIGLFEPIIMIGYKNNKENYLKKNLIRILKLYINFWIILLIFIVILGVILGQGYKYPGDVTMCYVDTIKVNNELVWRAGFGINRMCEDSWRWPKNNHNGQESIKAVVLTAE